MALGSRKAAFNLHFLGMWADQADNQSNIDYIRHLAGSLKRWSTGAAYLNFLGDEGMSRIEASFGPEKFARLQQLKAKWDPTNVFRHNQNIPPAPAVPPQR
jgi:FAD/FMN-containing dehydrogenase